MQESERALEFFAERVTASDDKQVLGAFDEQALVGVIGFVRNAGKKELHKGFVWGLYVMPKHRGRGLGRALFSEMMKRVDAVPGLRMVHLSFTASNMAAVKLYEAFGFTIYGIEAESLCNDGTLQSEYHMVRRTPGQAQTAGCWYGGVRRLRV